MGASRNAGTTSARTKIEPLFHTPGPWRATLGHNGQHEIKGPGSSTVAIVYHTPDGRGADNVDLISAAPDLLDALLELVSVIDSPEMHGIWNEMLSKLMAYHGPRFDVDRARAAIAGQETA